MRKTNSIIDDWLKENGNPEIEELVSLEAKLLMKENISEEEIQRIKELTKKYFN